MFTDWSLVDPHYFYFRGIVFGLVLATMWWRVLLPLIKRGLERFFVAQMGRRDE